MIPDFAFVTSRWSARVNGNCRFLDAGLPPEKTVEAETGGDAQHDHRRVRSAKLFDRRFPRHPRRSALFQNADQAERRAGKSRGLCDRGAGSRTPVDGAFRRNWDFGALNLST